MNPDELDVHEARHRPRGEGAVCQTCESLWPCAATRTATALREAWAEVERLTALTDWLDAALLKWTGRAETHQASAHRAEAERDEARAYFSAASWRT